MRMKQTVIFTRLALAIVVIGAARTVDAENNRPNIVFILADDLAWSDLGCYGNTLHDTPHLDRFANEGLRFTNAYAPAPICSASRAAILTGKTPARLKFEFVTKDKPGRQNFGTPLQSPPFTLNLPLAELTIGERLSNVGYRTAFFGKWHVSQHHNGYLGWSPTHGPKQQGFPISDSDFGSHPYSYRKDRKRKNAIVSDGQYPSDSLADQAVQFIKSQSDEPFFLYLSQYYVHDPIHTRSAWLREKYAARLPADALPIRASYAAMVETLDLIVGQVLAAIDQSEHRDNTLVVFMSDNGGHPNYTANSPLRGSKWNLYEGGIRVPCLIRYPSHIPKGVTVDTPIHGCDLLPTFCSVAGKKLSYEGIDGISLAPLLEQPTKSIAHDASLVWHFPYYHPEKQFHQIGSTIGVDDFVTTQTRPHSAIRSDNWKLIHFHEDDRVELFDLANDISEQHDLAAAEPAVVAQLRDQLAEYLNNVDARFPTRQ